MKVHIPYNSRISIGGGYTFYRNLLKGLMEYTHEVELVEATEAHDILFAFAPTTVSGEQIQRSKEMGAKFVLRMDGVPEDNRNSGKGTRRLVEYALQADRIIYQSDFIRNTVGRLLQKNGVTSRNSLIYNGVDLDIFRPEGEKIAFEGSPKILHMAYRKDPNKRYEEVLQMYRSYFNLNPQANLILLGRYPTEWQDYNMGFFNGERHKRIGTVDDELRKAAIIRSCDFMFYPSFADPAPNAVLEALACGVPVIYQPYGGAAEYMKFGGGMPLQYTNTNSYENHISRMMENLDVFKDSAARVAKDFSLEIMTANYVAAFNLTV